MKQFWDVKCHGSHLIIRLRIQGEDDGQTILPVGDYLAGRDGEKPVGVYALYDARRELQYVGFARNMVLTVKVSSS